MPAHGKRKRSPHRERPNTTLDRFGKRVKPYKKEVPVTVKTATRINKAKIALLENKVNGHVQRGYHVCVLRPTADWPGLSTGQPLLFCLNDFYTRNYGTVGGPGSIYFPTYTNVGPPTVPGGPPGPPATTAPKVISRWEDYLPGTGAQLTDEFKMWKDQQYAQPSTSGYQPLYTDLRFCIKRREVTPDQGDLWIRLDTFTARKFFIPQSQAADSKVYSMPAALGSLQNMAVQDVGGLRNSFNPALWRTKTRWIKLRRVDQPSKDLMRVFHVRMKFPKKFLKINLNTDSATNRAEEFWTTVDPKTPRWLLLSVSDNPATDNSIPDVTVTRKTVWRDMKGNSM